MPHAPDVRLSAPRTHEWAYDGRCLYCGADRFSHHGLRDGETCLAGRGHPPEERPPNYDESAVARAALAGIEVEQRRYLVGEQTVREDCANALQVLAGASCYIGETDTPAYYAIWPEDMDAVERLLRHALTQLEGTK